MKQLGRKLCKKMGTRNTTKKIEKESSIYSKSTTAEFSGWTELHEGNLKKCMQLIMNHNLSFL